MDNILLIIWVIILMIILMILLMVVILRVIFNNICTPGGLRRSRRLRLEVSGLLWA